MYQFRGSKLRSWCDKDKIRDFYFLLVLAIDDWKVLACEILTLQRLWKLKCFLLSSDKNRIMKKVVRIIILVRGCTHRHPTRTVGVIWWTRQMWTVQRGFCKVPSDEHDFHNAFKTNELVCSSRAIRIGG